MYVATSLSKMCNLKHICEEMIKICMLLQIMGNMGNFSITIIVNFSGVISFFLGGGWHENCDASFPEKNIPHKFNFSSNLIGRTFF